jgi:hypothetical protein
MFGRAGRGQMIIPIIVAKNVDAIILQNSSQANAACYNGAEKPTGLSPAQYAVLRHPC